MEAYCCSGSACGEMAGRRFLTKAEKVEMLRDYQKALENEAKGVGERIKTLESDE